MLAASVAVRGGDGNRGTVASVEKRVCRCREGRVIKSQRVQTSHGTHEIRPGLAGSQPGPAEVWMMTQIILGEKCRCLG